MSLYEWLEWADAQCLRGATLLSYESDVWTRALSREEEEILAAGAESGEVQIWFMPGAQFPDILTDGTDVFADRSSFGRMRQWDAFISLCSRGVIVPRHDGIYALSDAASIKGRRIIAARMDVRWPAF